MRSRIPYLIAAILTTIVMIGCGSSKLSKSQEQAATNADAVHACHTFVKRELKSPASAKFSGDKTSHVGETYTVAGKVDSQNSFGALIRNSYACTQTYDSSSQEWSLVSLDGLDN